MSLKMKSGRLLGFVLLGLLTNSRLAGAAEGTPHLLKIANRAGFTQKVQVTLQAGGTISIKSKGETQTHPMSVVAEQTYDQKTLPPGEDGASRTLRNYTQVEAAIKIADGANTPKLGEEHHVVIAEARDNKSVLVPVNGNFSREELDLLDVVGNPMLYDQLLPDKKVVIGDEWTVADDSLRGLLTVDRVSENSVVCKLEKVEDGQAQIAIAGTVEGSVAGAKTLLEIKARCLVDEVRQAATWFAIVIKERRSVGPVGPGLEVTAKVTVKLSPTTSADLARIEDIQLRPRLDQDLLVYQSPRGEFSLLHDRQWYVTSEADDLTVFRMVGKQDLIAQCNASAIRSTSPESPTSLEAYQKDVQQALGKNFGQFVKAQQGMDGNRRVLRVEAEGVVQEMPIDWVYYLLTDAEGRQVSLAFTYEQTLADQFAAADMQLVKSLTIHAQEPHTAQRPKK